LAGRLGRNPSFLPLFLRPKRFFKSNIQEYKKLIITKLLEMLAIGAAKLSEKLATAE
jgi:hypothetical protein